MGRAGEKKQTVSLDEVSRSGFLFPDEGEAAILRRRQKLRERVRAQMNVDENFIGHELEGLSADFFELLRSPDEEDVQLVLRPVIDQMAFAGPNGLQLRTVYACRVLGFAEAVGMAVASADSLYESVAPGVRSHLLTFASGQAESRYRDVADGLTLALDPLICELAATEFADYPHYLQLQTVRNPDVDREMLAVTAERIESSVRAAYGYYPKPFTDKEALADVFRKSWKIEVSEVAIRYQAMAHLFALCYPAAIPHFLKQRKAFTKMDEVFADFLEERYPELCKRSFVQRLGRN